MIYPRIGVALAVLSLACASAKPVLYPNERYKEVGEEAAHRDVNECLSSGKTYVKSNPLKPVVRKTGWAAATGAAIGATIGLLTGNIKGAVETGAAAGGVGAVMQGGAESQTPDTLLRAYTDRCLADKGYSVIGWR